MTFSGWYMETYLEKFPTEYVKTSVLRVSLFLL